MEPPSRVKTGSTSKPKRRAARTASASGPVAATFERVQTWLGVDLYVGEPLGNEVLDARHGCGAGHVRHQATRQLHFSTRRDGGFDARAGVAADDAVDLKTSVSPTGGA